MILTIDDTHPDVVALTGGIACGKSTTAELFRELGAITISADELARDVVEPGSPALSQIAVAFGPDVIDGTGALDRRRLGEIIFGDSEARRTLETITHPEIRRLALRRFAEARAGAPPLILYDCPLLFETRLDKQEWRAIVVVTAPDSTALARLMKRNDLSLADAEERLAVQLPIDEKAKRADYVIENDGTLEDLKAKVSEVFARIVARPA